MARIILDKNHEFTVKEWKAMNIIIAVVFGALFIFALYNLGFDNIGNTWFFLVIAGIILAMVWRYRKNNFSNILIFRINSDGIYYYNTFITGWDQFYNAYVIDHPQAEKFSDNFLLVLEFYRDDQLIRRNIKLTNTQNKSEEEIYGAIMYFYKQHTNGDVQTIDGEAIVVK